MRRLAGVSLSLAAEKVNGQSIKLVVTPPFGFGRGYRIAAIFWITGSVFGRFDPVRKGPMGQVAEALLGGVEQTKGPCGGSYRVPRFAAW